MVRKTRQAVRNTKARRVKVVPESARARGREGTTGAPVAPPPRRRDGGPSRHLTATGSGALRHQLHPPRLGVPHRLPRLPDHRGRSRAVLQPVRVLRLLRLGHDRRLRLLRAPLPRAHHRPADPSADHRPSALRIVGRGHRQPTGAGTAEQPAADHPRRRGDHRLRRVLGLLRRRLPLPDPARRRPARTTQTRSPGRARLPRGHHRLPAAHPGRRPRRGLGTDRLGHLLELGPQGNGIAAHLARLWRLPARQGGPRLGRTSRGVAARGRVRLSPAHLLRQPLLRRPAQLREVVGAQDADSALSTQRQSNIREEDSPMSPLPTGTKPKSWQQRIRESRLGTLSVLAVTATIVIGGAYLMDRPTAAASSLQAIELSGPTNGAPPKVGSPAQDFTATTVDGKQVSLSSYKGHPVWLTFGATWCAACKAEAPDIQAAYKKFEAKGVVVLAIFIREDSATVKDYGDRIGLTFPKVADPDTCIASAYRVYGIPAHFFIDASGILREIKTGGQSPEQMAAALTACLLYTSPSPRD